MNYLQKTGVSIFRDKYRPEIDGLRAIAVLAVVFYHAKLGFPGGYVGVDVFFVISGYLITSIIMRELQAGSFSLMEFWERRLRRILPAMSVCLAVTLVAGWFLLLPRDLENLARSALAQCAFVANIYFWRTTNYFNGENLDKPLLHTWSLAVEEQFYLIFPIALMAFWWAWTRWQKNKPDRILGTTNRTNLHENLTTDDTTERLGGREEEQPKVGPKGERVGTKESNKHETVKAGARLAGQAGAAFSNPSASQLARACENTSLIRSADTPAFSLDTNYTPPATAPVALALDSRPSSLDSSSPATSPIGDTRRWTLFWIFAAVSLLSFGISIWGVRAQPFATFFLLPTRAWELLLGSMLAVLPATMVLRSAALREILCLAGLAGIFLPAFFYGESTPFPGLAALPPCLGAAAIIFANSVSHEPQPRGYIAKALSWRPAVFIGLISYSLYLWHWPILAYADYWKTRDLPLAARWGLVAAAMLLAAASWRLVETPFRKRSIFPTRSGIFGFSAAASLALLSLSGSLVINGGAPHRLSNAALEVIKFLDEDLIEQEVFKGAPNISDINLIHNDKISMIGTPASNLQPSFLVLGDSHAQIIGPLFDSLAKRHGISGTMITYQGTPPLFHWDHRNPWAARDPKKLWQASLEYAKRNKIQNVFLVAAWGACQKRASELKIEQSILNTIDMFNEIGAKVYVLVDVPTYGNSIGKLVLRNLFFRISQPQLWKQTRNEHEAIQSGIFSASQKTANADFIDPTAQFLQADGISLKTDVGGKLLYLDSEHLTQFGVKTIWTPLLEGVFQSMSKDDTSYSSPIIDADIVQ